MDIKELMEQGDSLFGRRTSLESLWQEIADHFYPEREGFTVKRDIGDDFAAHLMSSYPVLMRRDLGNALSAMLRPAGNSWFHIGVTDDGTETNEERRWLSRVETIMRRAMYDPVAQFTRATKEGDHDFATFGQCVISVELNPDGNALLYRSWHLRDVAWEDGYDGKPSCVHVKWEPTAKTLAHLFPGKIHSKVEEKLKKSPYSTVQCRRAIVPADYGGNDEKRRFGNYEYLAITYDVDNKHIMEEVGINRCPFVIPRWQTVSGSQYAYSPATIAALPEARLMQAMTLTLLDAGERAADPPLVAERSLFRDDFNNYAGGVTWADLDGDRKLSDALHVLTNDKSGLPFGMEMRDRVQATLMDSFFLNKLNLPDTSNGDMTAYETRERVKEFIRNTLPLFEPMEYEYNGALCEETFELMLENNAFGPMDDMPRSLMGADVSFQFESPLHDAIEREKADKLNEALGIVGNAMQIDPNVIHNVDYVKAVRDALKGIGFDPDSMTDDDVLESRLAEAATQQKMQQAAQAMQMGGEAGEQVAKAGQQIVEAERAASQGA